MVLLRSKILGLIVNTLTAEYKYSYRNLQTFPQEVQMPLSLKKNELFSFFYFVPEISMKFKTFPKKEESSSLSISKNIDSERSTYLSV